MTRDLRIALTATLDDQTVNLWLKCFIPREMCSLSSQLMLNLNTEDLGVYHNGEVECLGLCHLAKLHAQQVFAKALILNCKDLGYRVMCSYTVEVIHWFGFTANRLRIV